MDEEQLDQAASARRASLAMTAVFMVALICVGSVAPVFVIVPLLFGGVSQSTTLGIAFAVFAVTMVLVAGGSVQLVRQTQGRGSLAHLRAHPREAAKEFGLAVGLVVGLFSITLVVMEAPISLGPSGGWLTAWWFFPAALVLGLALGVVLVWRQGVRGKGLWRRIGQSLLAVALMVVAAVFLGEALEDAGLRQRGQRLSPLVILLMAFAPFIALQLVERRWLFGTLDRADWAALASRGAWSHPHLFGSLAAIEANAPDADARLADAQAVCRGVIATLLSDLALARAITDGPESEVAWTRLRDESPERPTPLRATLRAESWLVAGDAERALDGLDGLGRFALPLFAPEAATRHAYEAWALAVDGMGLDARRRLERVTEVLDKPRPYHRQQLLWPVAMTHVALGDKEAARPLLEEMAAFGGWRGRRAQAWLDRDA